MSTVNPLSILVESQLPEFIRSDHPTFVAFIKAYYEWMDQPGNVSHESRKLLDYSDVDKTSEEFIRYFISTFLPYFPQETLVDKAKLIKSIREFYLKKGSEESLKFLFRVLYNEDIEVIYPKENILIASDGKWNVPQALRLTTSNTSPTFDVNLLEKRRGTGVNSKATCTIESAYRTIDVGTNRQIFEIFVSNVQKLFENGENLEVSFIDEEGEKVVLLSEKIIGSLSNVTIDPRNRGLRYRGRILAANGALVYPGDPVVFAGGLSQVDPEILEARAFVNNVTIGSVQSVQVLRGGYGFSQFPNTILQVVNGPNQVRNVDSANIIVSQVDTGNAKSVFINTDIIAEYGSVVLSDADYDFGNTTPTNIDTTLIDAFSYEQTSLSPIGGVQVITGGGGYEDTPSLVANSLYSISSFANAFSVNILALGYIAAIEVIDGGVNYDPNIDKIIINSGEGAGYGANISFTVGANGSITSANVEESGEGYIGPRNSLTAIVVNSSNALVSSNGTGAILRAYRFGEGESLQPTVDAIGRIIDFRLVSRGAGYVSVPEVSLRIKDLTINDFEGEMPPILEGQEVFQGSNTNLFTFYAKVDSYNAANSTLRIFNYSGVLDESANLSINTSPIYNVGVSNVITYGDGLAKARAEFLNGLIRYNGFYLNTDGFLSADKRLQDAKKYHNFSYVVVAEKALNLYRKSLLDIIHPAGTRLFGYNQLISRKELSPNMSTVNVSTSRLAGNAGSVSIDPFDSNNIVYGDGTTFENSKANDLIVISTGARKVVRTIENITDNATLSVDGGTKYYGDGKVRIFTNSNVIRVFSNTSPIAISAEDVLEFQYGPNNDIVFADVLGVSSNNITINIANSFIGTNDNTSYEVYPKYTNVSYRIISTD